MLGRGTDGSRLKHCEISGGSGLKGDLFEYTAMLSVHDAKDVEISDYVFRDSKLTDDMFHSVYADLRFERTTFRNAPSDAVDLDISTATIVDSVFVGSGNDGLDLMSADVQTILQRHGFRTVESEEMSL